MLKDYFEERELYFPVYGLKQVINSIVKTYIHTYFILLPPQRGFSGTIII